MCNFADCNFAAVLATVARHTAHCIVIVAPGSPDAWLVLELLPRAAPRVSALAAAETVLASDLAAAVLLSLIHI